MCLFMATKFYMETQDVVFNSDIAILLEESLAARPDKVNSMELAFLELLDFNLYVSLQDYNSIAN